MSLISVTFPTIIFLEVWWWKVEVKYPVFMTRKKQFWVLLWFWFWFPVLLKGSWFSSFFPSDFACKRSMMIYIRSIILFFYFLFFYFIFSVHNMKLSPNRGFMVVCGDNVPFVGSTEATWITSKSHFCFFDNEALHPGFTTDLGSDLGSLIEGFAMLNLLVQKSQGRDDGEIIQV